MISICQNCSDWIDFGCSEIMMSLVKFGAKIMTVVAVMTDRFQAVGISLQNSCEDKDDDDDNNNTQ